MDNSGLPDGFALDDASSTPDTGLPQGFTLDSGSAPVNQAANSVQNQNNPHHVSPSLSLSPDDEPLTRMLKGTFNQVSPYIWDKNSNMSNSQTAADVVKGGLSGAAQTAAGVATVPADALHMGLGYPAEYLATKAANAITGRNEQPDYPSSVTAPVMSALDYEPQSAAGERAKLASTLAGPQLLDKTVNALGSLGEYTVQGGSNMATGARALDTPGLQQAVKDASKVKDGLYDQAQIRDRPMTPDEIDDAQSAVNNAVARSGVIPNRMPGTMSMLNDFNTAADTGDMSVYQLEQHRRNLQGLTSDDSKAAAFARNAIDDHIDSLAQQEAQTGTPGAASYIQVARAAAAKQFAYERVAQLGMDANGDPLALTRKLKNFVADTDNKKGLTDDEWAALQNGAQPSAAQHIGRIVGAGGFNLHPSGSTNILIPWLTGAGKVATGAAAPAAIPVIAGGTLANTMRTYAARGKFQNALDLIGSRDLPPLMSRNQALPSYMTGSPSNIPPTGNLRPTNVGQLTNQFYAPNSRALSYQPRADFEVTPDGFAQRPSDIAPPAANPDQSAIASRAGDEMADRNVKRLMITQQPRSDFVATDNGIAQSPSDRVGALLGEDQDMPIDAGELQAMRSNPKWPAEKRGGAVNKKKGGRVIKPPKSYPAIEEMRRRA